MGDTFDVEVGPKGRIVIPAPVRRELGIEVGSQLVALAEGGVVVLATRDALKRRLRSMFAGVEGSLSEELIAERRADAIAEADGV